VQILKPDTAAEAVAMLAERGPSTRLAAGATALQAEWALGKARPATVIDIARLSELSGIGATESFLTVGANETLAAIIASPAVTTLCPLLADAALRVGAAPVRNRGTLGGNVGWRTGCLLPALLALDAELNLLTSEGPATVSLAEWLGVPPRPALITAIRIPRQPAEGRAGFRKIGLRAAFTPSVIAVSACLVTVGGNVSAARLAVGGGPVPATRLREIEHGLLGQEFIRIDWPRLQASIEAAIIAPDDTFRSARYRRRVGARALVSILSGQAPSGRATRHTIRPAPVSPPEETRLSRAAGGNRWHIRSDLPGKIAAELRYLTDRRGPGMLVGAVLRLDVPHARLLSIDTSAAESLPGGGGSRGDRS
jgi:CO/xanthine dehydrogenase FAD-binding subunit